MYLDDDESFLGGLNTNDLLFNWHPVLMVTGLIFCSITALVSFKVIPMDHDTKKYVHASLLHTVAVICMVLGITAVFQVLPFPRKLYDAEDIESTRYLEHTHGSNVIKTESGWTPGGLRKDNRKDIEVVVYRRLFVLP
eukprot:gene39032-51347_t